MTTVYTSVTVIDPEGEEVELELAAELSGDGEVTGLQLVRMNWSDGASCTTQPPMDVPAWALSQIDMRDLADDVLLKLQARERGWP